ncbi:MAG: Transposase IS200 like protein [Verrucomicrobia bacterium ADurb.Bin474]|nr:MAG: Transposase IS200 like protein [Verrucomicrobia bacterium ADurb.Bin474]
MQLSESRRPVFRGEDAVYHIVSRVSCGKRIFGDETKEEFVAILRRQAVFSGVVILAYCFMSDHFHLLVRVSPHKWLSDGELIERNRALSSGGKCSSRGIDPGLLERILLDDQRDGTTDTRSSNNADRYDAREWREKLQSRMGDVSCFMRETKQRFGIWYNQQHGNSGTIWADRYKSLIVEPSREAMAMIAAYIDLNCVRAGLVSDPADYRFCSYGAAVSGSLLARDGYCSVYGVESWDVASSMHRDLLFGRHCGNPGKVRMGRTSPERLRRALDDDEKLTLQEALRCRVRYFTDGMALGSQPYLARLLAEHPKWFSEKRKPVFAKMKGADWGGLRVVRNLVIAPIL